MKTSWISQEVFFFKGRQHPAREAPVYFAAFPYSSRLRLFLKGAQRHPKLVSWGQVCDESVFSLSLVVVAAVFVVMAFLFVVAVFTATLTAVFVLLVLFVILIVLHFFYSLY